MSSTSIARLIVVSSFHDHFWHLEKVRTPETSRAPTCVYGSLMSMGGCLSCPHRSFVGPHISLVPHLPTQ
jgi:hypothetical protein